MSKKIKISYFKTVRDTKPKTIFLDDWLEQTINPPKDLKKQVSKYRSLGGQNLKLKIPAVTISASFKKIRNLDNIKTKNQFIVLDIDRYAKSKTAPCNLCLDFDRAKEVFKSFNSCYYVGYSVSSDGDKVKDGMYAIIKLKKGTSLKKAFNFFKEKLQRIGINLDESCKDYTRLRFFSHDSTAFYNPEAKDFVIPKKKKIRPGENKGNASKTDTEKVETVIILIEDNAIDITSNYEDWYKIAGALNAGFGEGGRSYFHKISRFHHAYNETKTDRKYSNCTNMKMVTLSSFFHIANAHGIRY
jgi:hypothetical protein